MTVLKFALGTMACALLPAAILGAAIGYVVDRVDRRRDWQAEWDNLANEAAMWLTNLEDAP